MSVRTSSNAAEHLTHLAAASRRPWLPCLRLSVMVPSPWLLLSPNIRSSVYNYNLQLSPFTLLEMLKRAAMQGKAPDPDTLKSRESESDRHRTMLQLGVSHDCVMHKMPAPTLGKGHAIQCNENVQCNSASCTVLILLPSPVT